MVREFEGKQKAAKKKKKKVEADVKYTSGLDMKYKVRLESLVDLEQSNCRKIDLLTHFP